jgi:hypothetical protein
MPRIEYVTLSGAIALDACEDGAENIAGDYDGRIPFTAEAALAIYRRHNIDVTEFLLELVDTTARHGAVLDHLCRVAASPEVLRAVGSDLLALASDLEEGLPPARSLTQIVAPLGAEDAFWLRDADDNNDWASDGETFRADLQERYGEVEGIAKLAGAIVAMVNAGLPAVPGPWAGNRDDDRDEPFYILAADPATPAQMTIPGADAAS